MPPGLAVQFILVVAALVEAGRRRKTVVSAKNMIFFIGYCPNYRLIISECLVDEKQVDKIS
jgi:hypothetical protein